MALATIGIMSASLASAAVAAPLGRVARQSGLSVPAALRSVSLGAISSTAGAKQINLANVAPTPDFSSACSMTAAITADTCEAEVVAAINHAHGLEGVPPIKVSIPSLRMLSAPEQLLALVNLERISRHLPPFEGLSRQLDSLARSAAEQSTDPSMSLTNPRLANGDRVANWAGNWAGNISSPMAASYDFVYMDGPGSFNALCTTPSSSGCWGHRENILGSYPYAQQACAGQHVYRVMGASVLHASKVTPSQPSLAELFVAACGRPPTGVFVTWTSIRHRIMDLVAANSIRRK